MSGCWGAPAAEPPGLAPHHTTEPDTRSSGSGSALPGSISAARNALEKERGNALCWENVQKVIFWKLAPTLFLFLKTKGSWERRKRWDQPWREGTAVLTGFHLPTPGPRSPGDPKRHLQGQRPLAGGWRGPGSAGRAALPSLSVSGTRTGASWRT